MAYGVSHLSKELTTLLLLPRTTKNTMATEQDFYLVKKLFGMISMYYKYQDGELSQEMINRIEDKWKGFTWSWGTIPTNLFMMALEDLNKNPNLLHTYKNILKDSTQEELNNVWNIVTECIGMQFAYHAGELSQEEIKEVEDYYEGYHWSWRTLPTRMVVAVLNDMLLENSINF